MDIQKITSSTFEILEFPNVDTIKIGDKLKTNTGHNSNLDTKVWYYAKPKYLEYENLLLWIKKGLLIKIEPIEIETYKHVVRIIEIVDLCDSFQEILTRNIFTEITPHLESLGINQKLINMIPNGQSFFGKIEICSCGHSECYHRNAWIVHHGNSFIIPFCLSYASPHEWIEFGISSLRATYDPTTDYDSDDEEDIENRKVILDENGDIIHWEESENNQDYPLVAFNADYRIDDKALKEFDISLFKQKS